MSKLFKIKAELKQLHKVEYRGVQSKIDFWQSQLDQIQKLMQQGVVNNV